MPRFIRFETNEGPRWGRRVDSTPLGELGSIRAELLPAAPWDDWNDWDDPSEVATHDARRERSTGRPPVEVRPELLLAPATPSKIVCVGRNYRAHASELGNDVPSTPMLFLKPPSSLQRPGGPIVLPGASQEVHHEGELALVIGERLRLDSGLKLDTAARERAAAAVFGISAANDVTARDLQREDGKFTRAKGFDTFCPLGPELVRVSPETLGRTRTVETWIDRGGERLLRQRGTTDEMVFDALHLVAFVASIMTLLPGDVLLTGTPAGVGPVQHGDVVRVRVDGIPELVSPVAGERQS